MTWEQNTRKIHHTVDFIGEFENDNEAMGIVLKDLWCSKADIEGRLKVY